MAKKKKATKKEEKDLEAALDSLTADTAFSGIAEIEPEMEELTIQPLSVDFGREDLNTMGMKINEIIMFINRLNA